MKTKKYIKPSIRAIEVKEDVAACICGSQCGCRGGIREWWNWLWNGGCGCKVSGSFSTNSMDEMETESDLPQSKNLWDDEW